MNVWVESDVFDPFVINLSALILEWLVEAFEEFEHLFGGFGVARVDPEEIVVSVMLLKLGFFELEVAIIEPDERLIKIDCFSFGGAPIGGVGFGG